MPHLVRSQEERETPLPGPLQRTAALLDKQVGCLVAAQQHCDDRAVLERGGVTLSSLPVRSIHLTLQHMT